MLFTLCIGHYYLPADMIKTIVVSVLKTRTGDASNVNNYKPISMATIIRKVLDSVLNKRLEKIYNCTTLNLGLDLDYLGRQQSYASSILSDATRIVGHLYTHAFWTCPRCSTRYLMIRYGKN